MPSEMMTLTQVAELLQHPAPDTEAGHQKVRRLVARGMPVVPHTRPALFLRTQVLIWLATQAEADAAAADQVDLQAAVRPRRRRRRPTATGESALAARARELREGRG